MTTKRIKQQCRSCSGTGLYQGFAEAKGEAVVCMTCEGRGWHWHEYTAFEERKKRRGVKIIRDSQGAFLPTGVGGKGEPLSYPEFEAMFPVEGPRKPRPKTNKSAKSAPPSLRLVAKNGKRTTTPLRAKSARG